MLSRCSTERFIIAFFVDALDTALPTRSTGRFDDSPAWSTSTGRHSTTPTANRTLPSTQVRPQETRCKFTSSQCSPPAFKVHPLNLRSPLSAKEHYARYLACPSDRARVIYLHQLEKAQVPCLVPTTWSREVVRKRILTAIFLLELDEPRTTEEVRSFFPSTSRRRSPN